MRFIDANRGSARMSPLVLGICVGMTGCSGALFQSKAAPPTTYLLAAKPRTDAGTAAPAAAAPVLIAADLAVLKPRVRAGLDTDRIAAVYPDRRLDYFADARWSGPLDDVVQDLAVQAFRRDARLRNVSSDATAFASGYWVEMEVVDFQAEYSSPGSPPTINVRFLARLAGSGDRRILGSFDASARQVASDNRLAAIVDAYARAADAALARIVDDASRALTESLGTSLSR